MFSLSISATFHWSFLFAREFGKYSLLAGNIITLNEAGVLPVIIVTSFSIALLLSPPTPFI